jgi:hypothetical protein
MYKLYQKFLFLSRFKGSYSIFKHTWLHKVRTYKEYHSVCPSSELGLSQPLSRQRVFPSPQKQGGGGTLACGWGVGGSPNSDEGIHCGTLYMYVLCAWLGPDHKTLYKFSLIFSLLFLGNEGDELSPGQE